MYQNFSQAGIAARQVRGSFSLTSRVPKASVGFAAPEPWLASNREPVTKFTPAHAYAASSSPLITRACSTDANEKGDAAKCCRICEGSESGERKNHNRDEYWKEKN